MCRSPIAERLLRVRLRERLGPAADQVAVASAGTGALEGQPMDPVEAETMRSLFGSDDGFAAHRLTADQVRTADLVLTATREHRAATVRLAPQASRRSFTLREFSRLDRKSTRLN